MAIILFIETSEKICSVALSDNQKLICSRETELEKSHASKLTVLIEELFLEAGMSIKVLNAVAVSKGPGSYTGLRIGVSTAKGICFGLSIPLIAINTLYFLKYGLQNCKEFQDFKHNNQEFLFCSMIDARRMEVYRALHTEDGQLIGEIVAEEISSQSLEEPLSKGKILFIGSGADKCQQIIKHPNAFFINQIRPHAKQMIELASDAYQNSQFENLAYFEPFYLKDFVATTSKKNFLSF